MLTQLQHPQWGRDRRTPRHYFLISLVMAPLAEADHLETDYRPKTEQHKYESRGWAAEAELDFQFSSLSLPPNNWKKLGI